MSTDNEFNYTPFEGNMDFDRTVNTEVDKTRLFWIFILSTLFLIFVFIFGYWIGERNSSMNYLKLLPNQSVDLSSSIASNSDKVENPPAAASDSNSNTTNNQDSQVLNSKKQIAPAPNAPAPAASNIEVNNGTDASTQELNLLDQGNQESTNQQSGKKEKAPAVNSTHINSVKESKKVTAKPVNQKKISISKPKSKTTPAVKVTNSNSKYVIQLASLNTKAAAERLKQTLEKKGYSNVIVFKKGVLYRVRYTGFSSYAEAKKQEASLKKAANVKDTLILKLSN